MIKYKNINNKENQLRRWIVIGAFIFSCEYWDGSKRKRRYTERKFEDVDTERWIDRFPPNNKAITGVGAIFNTLYIRMGNDAKQRANDAWDIHVMTYTTSMHHVLSERDYYCCDYHYNYYSVRYSTSMKHPDSAPTLVNGFTYSRVVRPPLSISSFASRSGPCRVYIQNTQYAHTFGIDHVRRLYLYIFERTRQFIYVDGHVLLILKQKKWIKIRSRTRRTNDRSNEAARADKSNGQLNWYWRIHRCTL